MRVIVDMPTDLVSDLDERASRIDRSRSWCVRQSVREWATQGLPTTERQVMSQRLLMDIGLSFTQLAGVASWLRSLDTSAALAADILDPDWAAPANAIVTEPNGPTTGRVSVPSNTGHSFTAQRGNALRCEACGRKKGEHA